MINLRKQILILESLNISKIRSPMMKKIFILTGILMIFLEMKTIPVCAWGSSKHQELVENNSSYGNLTPSQIKLTSYCAVLADDKAFRGGGLHGTSNYVKNLEFLYTCAYNLKNNVKDPITSALDTNYNDPIYKKLYEKINLLLSKKLLPGEEEKSNSAKAAKVLGFACHLAGDIYAHRTIVPVDADKELFEKTWDRWIANIQYTKDAKKDKLPTFGMLFGNALEENGQGRLLIKEGKASFLSIKGWAAQAKKGENYTLYIARAFEDNPEFYNERYEKGAMELTKNLLTLYGENRSFDDKFVFNTSCLLPLQPAER